MFRHQENRARERQCPARPVSRDGVELGRQPSGDLLPVGGRAWLPVQQHQFVITQRAR